MELQNHLFELDRETTYLNGAYMSPLLKSVAEVGKQQVLAKLKPYLISGDDFFEDVAKVKTEFSTLINAQDPNRIAIIPSVSYGLANVVKNVEVQHKEILLLGEQFPSNVYPWMELEKTQHAKIITVEPPNTFENRGEIWNKNLLNAINEKTGIVAIAHTHWADGTWFDLEKIRARTLEVGALLIIDGTQSVGALPFDVQAIQPDALICAGYKWLMGPYGIGVAYYGSAFDNGNPIEQNWINRKDSKNFAGLVNYEEQYEAGVMRYSVGEQSNFILVPMLLESLKQLNSWGANKIQAYCQSITDEPLSLLKQKGYWVEDIHFRASHLFGIRKEGMNVAQIKAELEKHHIFVSIRGSSIRVSPNVYNTEKDMMKLVEVLN